MQPSPVLDGSTYQHEGTSAKWTVSFMSKETPRQNEPFRDEVGAPFLPIPVASQQHERVPPADQRFHALITSGIVSSLWTRQPDCASM